MAVDQEQRAEALNNAIVMTFTDNELETIDGLALIGKITGAISLKVPHVYDALDSIYINGVRITDTLDENSRKDPKSYADVLRVALRPENNSFVSIKPVNESVSSMRAIIYDNESLSPEETAANEQKIENAINFAAEFKEDAVKRQKTDALNNAIKVSPDLNDIDLIKSITGVEDINASNKRKVLGSIYINGKNLSDMLGEDKEDNIEEYAKAVREALDINNNSFITIMKRNSVFSNPRAVIPENNYTSPEEQALAEKKAEVSADFVAGYRETVSKKVRDAKAKRENRIFEDEKLFFSSIFDGNEDVSGLSKGAYEAKIKDKFNNIISNFVNTRTPQNQVYAYMLTLDYPEGSGNKLTIEQILTDDSPEMKAFKAKSGKEFCRIFQKPKENDPQYANDAEYYNAVTYPTLMKMTEAALHMEMHYHDLNDVDDIENTMLDSEKNSIVFDFNQQLQRINVPNLARINGLCSFYNNIYKKRLEYLESDNFLNDTMYRNRSFNEELFYITVKSEVIVESADINDIKKASETVMGKVEPENSVNFDNANIDIDKYVPDDYEVVKFVNGEDNEISKWGRTELDHKKVIRETAVQVERDKDKEVEDYVIEGISLGGVGTGSLRYDFVKEVADNGNKNSRREYSSRKGFDGTNNSLIAYLTGCQAPNNGRLVMSEAHLMAAVRAIYVNGQSLADRFDLNKDNIAEKYEEIDKTLATMLINTMECTEKNYITIKNGKDSFNPVIINYMSLNSVYRGDFATEEEYNAAKENVDSINERVSRNRDAINERKKSIKAYASIMSGKADKETMDKFKDMEMPGVKIGLDDIMDFEGKQTGTLVAKLGELSGKTIPQNPEDIDSKAYSDFADNIYIGNKKTQRTLSQSGRNVKYRLCQKDGGVYKGCL